MSRLLCTVPTRPTGVPHGQRHKRLPIFCPCPLAPVRRISLRHNEPRASRRPSPVADAPSPHRRLPKPNRPLFIHTHIRTSPRSRRKAARYVSRPPYLLVTAEKRTLWSVDRGEPPSSSSAHTVALPFLAIVSLNVCHPGPGGRTNCKSWTWDTSQEHTHMSADFIFHPDGRRHPSPNSRAHTLTLDMDGDVGVCIRCVHERPMSRRRSRISGEAIAASSCRRGCHAEEAKPYVYQEILRSPENCALVCIIQSDSTSYSKNSSRGPYGASRESRSRSGSRSGSGRREHIHKTIQTLGYTYLYAGDGR
ncbi:hypothetical protein OH76DRAFT_370875 [Lentinus brumalis]|uniref:Uncharacterized protein n=1 Tax=Lentinus brumalis TaxID=2498619 RepID=A0A371DEA4_9APHY|nr:hypothetical protein OH76DRAFT_370875 [Polyporus brumalis]